MKKEIYRRINHVLRVLGAKKKEVIDARDESENADSAFFELDETPPVVEAADEEEQRFVNYMGLEADIDLWVERRHREMVREETDLSNLLEIVNKDMLSFKERIANI